MIIMLDVVHCVGYVWYTVSNMLFYVGSLSTSGDGNKASSRDVVYNKYVYVSRCMIKTVTKQGT
jgi:hypothetical protein